MHRPSLYACSRWLLGLALALGALRAAATEIVVHPFNGDNRNAGTPEAPLRDFAAAMALAQPGDTIRYVPVDEPVRAQVRVNDRSGAPGQPIVVDGAFNTFIGTLPVDEAQWEEVQPGLFKRVRNALPQGFLNRYFMCFHGQMNRMGRRGKWPGADLKAPEDLREYEWTIAHDRDFYFRIPAGKRPAECDVEEPVLHSGVQINGASAHWIFRNMIVKNFWNDGYNIHGSGHDLLFENVAALDNGDDGISAHGTSRIVVRNYVAIGNGTGICHINEAEGLHENVYIAAASGREIYLLNRKNELRNAVVIGGSPGGIEFTSDSKVSGDVGETHLAQCLFFSPVPDGRLVLRPQSRVTADEVTHFQYRTAAELPEGWRAVADAAALQRQMAGIAAPLLALFEGRLPTPPSAAAPTPAVPNAIGPEKERPMLENTAKYKWPDGVYPFEPDGYTLLLAHFDEHLERADYAMGYPRFGGMGWQRRAGAYGSGLDLDRQFLAKDFYQTADSALPFYFNFGFSPHGNFNHYQGTLEFWFLLKDEQAGVLFHSDNGRHGISSIISPEKLAIVWPGLGAEDIRGTVRFPRPLGTDEWHYYTQTWSAGEFAVYIDGRLVFTQDMQDVVGIVSSRVDKPGIYIGGQSFGSPLGGGARLGLDELAVSSVVRYVDDFEPPWQAGQRPAHAFEGLADRPPRFRRVEERPALAEAVPAAVTGDPVTGNLGNGLSVRLDPDDGFIKAVAGGERVVDGEVGGVLIWEGLERAPLFHEVTATDVRATSENLSFRQQYGDGLVAASRIAREAAHTVWELTLTNTTNQARWLEVQLALPLPLAAISEYFDGSTFHQDLRLPRRKDEFAKTLPFSAAGNAVGYVGLGLFSDIWVSDLINEWIPLPDGSGVIRQGFKTVIAPHQETAYRFLIVSGESPYGAHKALERYYHAAEQTFYRKNPAVSVLMHLPCAYVITQPQRTELPYGLDVARRLYCGHGWRFEPHYGIKGDEAGIGPYFKNEAYRDRPEYEFARNRWDQYADLEAFRRRQRAEAETSYLNNYTQHVRHWHPQTLNRLIINDLYPEGLDLTGDKRQCGAKYAEGLIKACTVNTYNTPLYDWNRKQVDFFVETWGAWNKGFCHDTTYDCTARATDPLARQTTGRSFSRDRGEFLRLAFGFAQHFQYLGTRRVGAHALAALGDGSYMSYLTATTADKHLTEEMRFNDNLGYPGRFSTGRIMAGEKPFDAPIGRLLSADRSYAWLGDPFMDLTERELRDYYRYFLDQYLLHCFRHGVYMSALLTHGKQKQVEHRALLVEAILAGHRIVTAATADGDLFVTRYGEKLDTILVVGNPKPYEQTTAVVVDGQEIHGGGALVVGDFYGGVAELIFDGPRTIVPEVRVGRRDVRAWRALGALDGPGLCSAQVTYEGDGLTFRSTIVVSAAAGQTLRFTPFVPADYEVERLTGNGEALTRDALGAVTAATGDGRVVLEVNYKHSLLDLPPATWRDAVLLQADAAQIQVVMPEEAGAFDQGTLNWLNHFLLAYDYEDNIVGNLAPLDPAPGGTPPAAAWQLTMDTTGLAERTAVLLDGPQIVVTGRDAFARRRAMAVFMRLLDRKYPAVGHFLFPADLKAYESLDAMLDRKVAQLIEAHNLHRKPLLDDAHEPLYAGDNLDFHGKYVLRVSPYIYEPGDWR